MAVLSKVRSPLFSSNLQRSTSTAHTLSLFRTMFSLGSSLARYQWLSKKNEAALVLVALTSATLTYAKTAHTQASMEALSLHKKMKSKLVDKRRDKFQSERCLHAPFPPAFSGKNSYYASPLYTSLKPYRTKMEILRNGPTYYDQPYDSERSF